MTLYLDKQPLRSSLAGRSGSIHSRFKVSDMNTKTKEMASFNSKAEIQDLKYKQQRQGEENSKEN